MDGTSDSAGLVRARLEEVMQRSYVAAHRILGNGDQARDACQEAAARALSASHRYDPELPFYPWFYRILKNHCLDRLKVGRRTVATGEGPNERDGSPSAEGALLRDERGRAVARAIAALPAEQREIVELRHFQDLSYDEMASVLGCPVGTVMSRLYRARRHLRELLLADAGFRGHADDGRGT